ncbi:MAG TPA: DUF4383 domain-containing protein [Acidimicrobiia bacterium]|nr:DUF4383 domain-containing protein [Acidimicrobiia bacterium]
MATRATSPQDRVERMSAMQKGAGLVGAVFLLVGILGFIPGITTNFGDITFATEDSEAELLGLFQVNILHNIVHLAFGVVGIWAAMRTWDVARTYLLVGGLVYLALWLYGLVVDLDSDANFAAFNTADNWLHFGLGVGMIGLGTLLSGERTRRTRARSYGHT